MNNNWNYDSVCTIVQSHRVEGRYYTTWRSTDGNIYTNSELQDRYMSYKIVKWCETCRRCPAQQQCLHEIKTLGKTIY
jgi:hypothetical protein